MLACLWSSQAWPPPKEPICGSFGGPSCSNMVHAVRVGVKPRLRRLISDDHQRDKCFCGKKAGGRPADRGNQRLWIVLVKTATLSWIDCPQKWIPDLDSGSIIESKSYSFKPSEESDSNVEVTGDPLEPPRGSGMFVV